jgi:hypothetical protein
VIIQAAVLNNGDCVTGIGINPVSTQGNRVIAQQKWQEAIVPVTGLDTKLGSVPTQSRPFIKSDTQGFDVSVIKSGYRELSRRKTWMLRCKFAPHWMESQGFSPVSELEWLCVNFQVFEAPLRSTWISRSDTIFKRPIEACQANSFVDYAKSLNHQEKGWVDLYLVPRN